MVDLDLDFYFSGGAGCARWAVEVCWGGCCRRHRFGMENKLNPRGWREMQGTDADGRTRRRTRTRTHEPLRTLPAALLLRLFCLPPCHSHSQQPQPHMHDHDG